MLFSFVQGPYNGMQEEAEAPPRYCMRVFVPSEGWKVGRYSTWGFDSIGNSHVLVWGYYE